MSGLNTPQTAWRPPSSSELDLPRQGEAPLVEHLPKVRRRHRRVVEKLDRDVARLAATVLVIAVFAYAVIVALLLN